jgi:hypothetical protein
VSTQNKTTVIGGRITARAGGIGAGTAFGRRAGQKEDKRAIRPCEDSLSCDGSQRNLVKRKIISLPPDCLSRRVFFVQLP